jgi:protein TonB
VATVAANRDSFPRGVAASVAIHLVAAAYVVISFSNPQALQPPSDLSKAIPISLEMFRPTPPPEPPKPIVEPEAPKDVVTTTAPEPEAEIEEAPAEPSETAPPPEPSLGNPSPPTYASLVAGILERSKRYPKDALHDGVEGVVDAYFVVNKQGHVIAYRIEKGSGSKDLDYEVVRLLKFVRFPPIPDDGGDPQRREFRFPITFNIKDVAATR